MPKGGFERGLESMANEDNLIPANERSLSEAREMGRKGGKASGKARRKKANLKRTLESLLSMDIPDAKLKRQLEELGLDPTLEQGLALSVLLTTTRKGNMKDLSTLMEMLQQTATPADKKEQKARIERMQAETQRISEEADRKSGRVGAEVSAKQTKAIADMINSSVAERVLTDFLGVREGEQDDDSDTNKNAD